MFFSSAGQLSGIRMSRRGTGVNGDKVIDDLCCTTDVLLTSFADVSRDGIFGTGGRNCPVVLSTPIHIQNGPDKLDPNQSSSL